MQNAITRILHMTLTCRMGLNAASKLFCVGVFYNGWLRMSKHCGKMAPKWNHGTQAHPYVTPDRAPNRSP